LGRRGCVEFLQGNVDRPWKALLAVSLAGQNVDELRARVKQLPDLLYRTARGTLTSFVSRRV